MGAQKSRLDKAGGNYQQAMASLVQEQHPDVLAAVARGDQAWLDRKLRQSTKGKFSGPLGAIGKVVSKVAPYALPLIPGVGPLAAGLTSAAIGKLSGKGFGESLLQGAGSAAGSALLGGQGFKGFGGAADKLGTFGKSALGTIGKTLKTPTGELDLGKIAGVGMGIAQLGGQRAQRQSAQARLGSEDALRNQLIQRLLEKPNYNFQPGL